MSEPRERRLIAEWARERHPDDRVWLNTPVGVVSELELDAVDTTKQLARLRSWRLKADAIVVTGTTLKVVEAKIVSVKNGLGDLMLYRELIPDTPELQPFLPRQVECWLVAPWVTDYIVRLAERLNILIDVYNPAWVRDYVIEHSKYYTRPYQAQRAERRRVLSALGLE
jgi:hypothetical protein